MKFVAASVVASLASSQAFCVQPTIMKTGDAPKATSRADFAKFTAGAVAATVAVAAPALAKPGTGPKQNIFGIVGTDMNLGGGFSSYVPESDTYSAYSPYGDPKKSLYKSDDGTYMTKIKIDVLKSSQKKFQEIPGYLDNKRWEEVRSVLTNKAYSLRDAMNSLSKDKPEAGKVAKAFYRDIEKLTVSSRRKDANTAKQAYESAQSNLSKYLSLL